MRAMLTLLFILGAVVMSEEASGQDKKIPDPNKAESYDRKVTVRFWDGAKFIKGVENVPAFKYEKDGVVKFWTKAQIARAGNPDKDSEIIDQDGTVYVCEKVGRGKAFHVCTVKAK